MGLGSAVCRDLIEDANFLHRIRSVNAHHFCGYLRTLSCIDERSVWCRSFSLCSRSYVLIEV